MQFDLKLIDHSNGTTTIKSLTFKGQNFNREITGQMADARVDQEGVQLIRQLAEKKGLVVALPCDEAKAEWE